MVDYIGVERIQALMARVGVARLLTGLAKEIEADFLRWSEFEKSARHAIHSNVGVIELMPTADGKLYSFKYVNGHPKNTAEGLLTVTAFGVLADVATARALGLHARHVGVFGLLVGGLAARLAAGGEDHCAKRPGADCPQHAQV